MPAATLDELTLADEPAAWAALGFAVDDGCLQLGSVQIALTGAHAGKGILGWSLHDIDAVDLDGLPTTISTKAPATSSPEPHPNGIVAIDHVVAISPDLDRTVTSLSAAGLDLRRVREQPTPAGAPRQAFFRLGAEILEVIQEPADVATSSGGADRPTRFWGLALIAEDLDRTAEQLAPHLSDIRAAVQPQRRIATLRRSAGLTLPVALMSPTPRKNEQ
jgi:hypothetical protein